MFTPITLNLTQDDIRSTEKELFVSFRKNLKKLICDEYCDIFGEVCEEKMSKKIMMSIKDFSIFNGNVAKHPRQLNSTSCGILLANTVFVMFQMLCSLQAEYRVEKHISRLSGIVNDAGRGLSAIERVVFAINTIYEISANHEFFDIVQGDISAIDAFMEKTFACEIECY